MINDTNNSIHKGIISDILNEVIYENKEIIVGGDVSPINQTAKEEIKVASTVKEEERYLFLSGKMLYLVPFVFVFVFISASCKHSLFFLLFTKI